MKQCDSGHFYDEARYETCPYCSGAQVNKTVGLNANPGIPKTLPVKNLKSPVEKGKTVGIIKKNLGIDPVVGFLVCVYGPHKGEDFKLMSGRNFLGRTPDMDISLADDDTVSRENHALLSYDSKSNNFMLSPGTGRGITYLNEKQIEVAEALNIYDIIEVGSSKLIFLPLCCDKFKW